MRVLVLDSALARCTAAVVVDETVIAARSEAREQGHEAVLPVMARDVLDAAVTRQGDQPRGDQPRGDQPRGDQPRGDQPRGDQPGRDQPGGDQPRAIQLDLIAVTVGPGSFTGIRAGLALAHGIGLALAVPVIGVTVGEAIADAFPHLGERVLWTVTDSRRGHVFLEHTGEIVSLAVESLPAPAGKVAIAGGAAAHVAARLAAAGANVMLTDARYPLPRHIALVAARRHAGTLPPRPARPLYVDPPEARPQAVGVRPPPMAAPPPVASNG
jgi:tRNA threonylcarbamoyl adenosine modification protein YeaZ